MLTHLKETNVFYRQAVNIHVWIHSNTQGCFLLLTAPITSAASEFIGNKVKPHYNC
ncbi:hypothetical protein I79_005416 [Cricetulus griseus]|uniref:Uncharacterized protein n=1 Tax=Cricetulus griseus TaxID=10029 RepID=G3H546_CRIGR|nr:hypothetical protein I79_005416 [Cricetulus griseus]